MQQFSRISEVSERRLIDRSLEHDERVSSVVGVERLTICAKVLVLGAECAPVPLSDDKHRVRVADGLGMR